MGATYKGKYQRLAVIAGLVVILDQITKLIVLKTIPLYQSISVIPGLFHITHIHNPGGAFGFLSRASTSVRYTVFLIVSSLAIFLVFYIYKTTPKEEPAKAVGSALILGGAVGNMIDRVRFGKVVDFLDFFVGSWHWPAFNIADSAITIGVAVFAVSLVFSQAPEPS